MDTSFIGRDDGDGRKPRNLFLNQPHCDSKLGKNDNPSFLDYVIDCCLNNKVYSLFISPHLRSLVPVLAVTTLVNMSRWSKTPQLDRLPYIYKSLFLAYVGGG